MKLTSHIKVYHPYEVCMKSASYFKVHISDPFPALLRGEDSLGSWGLPRFLRGYWVP